MPIRRGWGSLFAVARVGRWSPAEQDRLLALALLAVGQLEVWSGARTRLVSVLVVAATTGALAWRRRAPLSTVAVVVAGFVAHVVLTGTPPPGLGDAPNSFAYGVAWLVAVYSVAAHAPLLRGLAGLALAGIASVSSWFSGGNRVEDVLLALLFSAVVPWLVGELVARHRRASRLRQVAERLAREGDQRAHDAVKEERSRIARELHDIVAHGVTMMVVQAEAGEALLSREPDRATEAFRSIQKVGRQALVELRRLLGIMRVPDGQLALSPQPGLSDLESFITDVHQAGLTVELAVEGPARRLPAGVDLSAFRIIQEALTNVLKHAAPGARAAVRVRYGESSIEVEVVDDGVARKDGHEGHGLVGMRERVALFSGELEVGPRPEGGYAVRARLPVE